MKTALILAALACALFAQTPQTANPSVANSPWDGGSRGVTVTPSGQAGPVLARPLAATEIYRTIQLLADGTRVDHTDSGRFYRDDRGRMRTEGQGAIAIFDPVAAVSYLLRPDNKTYSQSPIGNPNSWTWVSAAGKTAAVTSSPSRQELGDPAARIAQRRYGLPDNPPVTESLTPRLVNGIMASGSRVTITIPRGALGNDRDMKVVNERWYSDDLKVLVKSVNTDPRYGLTTYDLINLVQGPQPPALFQVPVDFKLPPSR
jgi:hypothetical protein